MKLFTRRKVLWSLGIGAAGLVGARFAVPALLRPGPVRPVADLSAAARRLVEQAFADVDRTRVWDGHVHVVGLGAGGSGCWVNPEMRSHLHPLRRFQYEVYMAAAGIRDEGQADIDYLERLLAQHRAANPAGRMVLLAFDYQVDEAGAVRKEESEFHAPNAYVADLAARNVDVEFCASVHPYRTDALARLEAARAQGAVGIKWLPNAMGIDPLRSRCDAFYDKLVELGLVLVSHGGLERAVHADDAQELGNPLRLRRALDHGVKVVVAHCASLGTSKDLDAVADGARADSFDLFLRLMGEKQYEANLFGDLSAVAQVNRCGRPLRELLCAADLHPRLVNGSDYPLPAIDTLVSTRYLQWKGYLDPEHRGALNEIFAANPLLFDYVLKRNLRWCDEDGIHRFAPAVFETARLFA